MISKKVLPPYFRSIFFQKKKLIKKRIQLSGNALNFYASRSASQIPNLGNTSEDVSLVNCPSIRAGPNFQYSGQPRFGPIQQDLYPYIFTFQDIVTMKKKIVTFRTKIILQGSQKKEKEKKYNYIHIPIIRET